MRCRCGLRESVTFDIGDADFGETLCNCRRHGSSPAAESTNRSQVELSDIRVGKKVLNHGRDRRPARDPVSLDALRRRLAIPPRQQYHSVSNVKRAIHTPLHASHVKQWSDGQHRHFGWLGEPVHAGDRRVHDGTVCVHTALRSAGGTGGVGHDAQIVGPRSQGTRRQVACEHVLPK